MGALVLLFHDVRLYRGKWPLISLNKSNTMPVQQALWLREASLWLMSHVSRTGGVWDRSVVFQARWQQQCVRVCVCALMSAWRLSVRESFLKWKASDEILSCKVQDVSDVWSIRPVGRIWQMTCGKSVGMNRVSDVQIQLNLQIIRGQPALIHPTWSGGRETKRYRRRKSSTDLSTVKLN